MGTKDPVSGNSGPVFHVNPAFEQPISKEVDSPLFAEPPVIAGQDPTITNAITAKGTEALTSSQKIQGKLKKAKVKAKNFSNKVLYFIKTNPPFGKFISVKNHPETKDAIKQFLQGNDINLTPVVWEGTGIELPQQVARDLVGMSGIKVGNYALKSENEGALGASHVKETHEKLLEYLGNDPVLTKNVEILMTQGLAALHDERDMKNLTIEMWKKLPPSKENSIEDLSKAGESKPQETGKKADFLSDMLQKLTESFGEKSKYPDYHGISLGQHYEVEDRGDHIRVSAIMTYKVSDYANGNAEGYFGARRDIIVPKKELQKSYISEESSFDEKKVPEDSKEMLPGLKLFDTYSTFELSAKHPLDAEDKRERKEVSERLLKKLSFSPF